MDREVLVYVDLLGQLELVGRLRSHIRQGKESAAFEYDSGWLRHHLRSALEPALALGAGLFHARPEKALLGAIGDSAPDQWGRTLMCRAERRQAEREARPPHSLAEIDFLLQVDDELRQGALRFKTEEADSFLATKGRSRSPPLVNLPSLATLLEALKKVTRNEEEDEDLGLFVPFGSSLGGARPKTSVKHKDGTLALAKFPHGQDEVNVVLWEAVALELAERAGIQVPRWCRKIIGDSSVLLLHRFDRAGEVRIPFLSAMSMIDAQDNDIHSYLEIADALRRYGSSAKEDLAQLWRRLLFNILISNTDDHLRNHGFLFDGYKGWRLSPAYDLNPVPADVGPRILFTAIDQYGSPASIDLALATCDYYGLKLSEAKAIAGEVVQAVAGWRQLAVRLGVETRELNRMESAFEHEDLRKAKALR